MDLTKDGSSLIKLGPPGLVLSRMGKLVQMIRVRNRALRERDDAIALFISREKSYRALQEEIVALRSRLAARVSVSVDV